MKPEQVRMARAALGLGVRELAEAAGVTAATITRFETAKGGIQLATAEALRAALEARGIHFIESGQVAVGSGVTFKGISQ